VYQKGQGTFGEEENLLCMTGIENRDRNVNIQLGHHTCPLRTAFLFASKLAGGFEKQPQHTLYSLTCQFVYEETYTLLDSNQNC